jgi:toxin YoeB
MVRQKIIWSAQAKIDQYKILDFSYKRIGNKTYSRKLYKKFKNAINLLSEHPKTGIKTDVKDIRNLIEGDYAIFYKIEKNSIVIITIWDCRQNPDKLQYK